MSIKELVKKRGTYKGQLTLFSNHVVAISDVPSASLTPEQTSELQLRILKIESVFSKYDEIQTEIECLSDEDDVAVQVRERGEFESKYFKILATAKVLFDRNHGSVSNSKTGSTSKSNEIHINNDNITIKFPTIAIPTFSGAYDSWLEYHDTFKSLIHDNESISNISKFHYLRASLEGRAALVINSLEFSSDNYTVAWNLLHDRYDNKRALVHNHVSALFNIDPVKKETSGDIRRIIDQVNKNIRALNTLNEPTQQWDTLLVHMVVNKLDAKTTRGWEEHRSSHKDVTLNTLTTFLRNRADVLETLESNSHENDRVNESKGSKFKGLVSVDAANSSPQSVVSVCPKCQEDHHLVRCPEFLSLTNEERSKEVSNYRLCYNCLRPGHYIRQCRSSSCRICRRRHHSILHVDREEAKEMTTQECSLSANSGEGSAILSTALVNIWDKNNKVHTVRAVLDCAATACLITQRLCKRLGLSTTFVENSVTGLNKSISAIDNKCKVRLSSLNKKFSTNLSCYVIEYITCDTPFTPIDRTELNIPTNISLADPMFHEPGPIDLLLGNDIFWDLIKNGQISLGKYKLRMRNTKLGWIVIPQSYNFNTPSKGKIVCNIAIESVQNQLAKFWELEEVSIATTFSKDDIMCEDHFVNNTTRLQNGRFCVRIPLKHPEDVLGHSYKRAEQCLLSLERRLQRQPALREMYVKFMNEYESLGHMSEQVESDNITGYYMPHHGVLREKSTTTKLRVVFNASSNTSTGKSCNDIQMVGPVIQDDLASILLRFRTYNIVLSADIEKMYRQTMVNEKDRHLQKILWRNNPIDPLKVYELNTVTYGTASAPFLAVRCLKQLALECDQPDIAQILMHDFYVDDLLSGGDTLEQALHIRAAVTKVLSSACMNIRKWRSNEQKILQPNNEIRPEEDLNLGGQEESKILGLGWHSIADELFFTIDIQPDSNVTKRSILSSIGRIFDPLGLLVPCVIESKILLQKLWLHKLSWDEPVPLEVSETWAKFTKNLSHLNHLRIPRLILCDSPIRIEFHVFTDASESAYGACLYVLTENNRGVILTRLLFSKSRVAPIKPTTIPRLELCGALVGARLYEKARKSLRLKIDKVTFWTDSSVVLGWLRMLPNKLKPFVRNRVSDILEITGNWLWRHVPTKDNPADYMSRGMDPSVIVENEVWWSGPKYLQDNESLWPPDFGSTMTESLPELKPLDIALSVVISSPQLSQNELINFNRFSKLTLMKRTVAYVMRFVYNCRNPRQRKIGYLTATEINAAFKVLLKYSQKQSFPDEYKQLSEKKALPCKNQLLKLNPFIDDKGILRVGGRLANSEYDYTKKYPILIKSTHHISSLIFKYEHLRLMHAGPQLLLASVRQEFWCIGGRNAARYCYHKCIVCSRMRGQTIAPIMGQLPRQRLQPGHPFVFTGVDYAGPITSADRKGRGCKILKVYIALFVCFITKSIHLELVTDLTTSAFLLSLRRFISRRGKPNEIFSDNGTTFVGTDNYLSKFLKVNSDALSDQVASEGIKFNFIPAYAPHFGGLWEAGVKSTKFHLRRVLGNSNLTFEELYTVLAQIEAILNSRPLSPLSSDPDDCLPLTPGHFLIGRPLTALPSPDYQNHRTSYLSRYERVEQLRQHFWQRWQKEYISELQQRVKWKQTQSQLEEGTMVVIKEDHVPPLKWTLGRVIKVYPGKDGISRVADIKTTKGVLRRAFNRICPLPLHDEPNSYVSDPVASRDC